jgi:hypothetical protein
MQQTQTFLSYAKPEDEINLSKTLAALSNEFGVDRMVICLPAEWRQYRTELSGNFPGDVAYVTEFTIEVTIKGTTLSHVVQLQATTC